MQVQITDDREDPLEPGPLAELAESVLAAEGCPEGTEVDITFVDVETMASHNAAALGGSGPTDVLAFPLEEAAPGAPPQRLPAGPPPHLGDVVICPGVVRDNARDAGVPFEDEMALMVVHGLLHLLGYDHVTDADAEQMEDRERVLLSAVGRTRP